MLVLGRNIGDTIVINDNIYITIFETSAVGNKFKVAIDAPAEMKISRGEHYADDAERWEKIKAMKAESLRRSRRALREEHAAMEAQKKAQRAQSETQMRRKQQTAQKTPPRPRIGY